MLESRGLDQRALESSQNVGLKRDELADNSLTNRAKRDAAGMEIGAAKQLADLRTAYLNAKTPEEQATAIARLNALSGKGQAQDEYMTVSSGQTADSQGIVTKDRDLVFNKRTGQFVGGQPKQATNMPKSEDGLPIVSTPDQLATLQPGAKFRDESGNLRTRN